MECSKSVNEMFWNAVFIWFYTFPKGVPFRIHYIWYFLYCIKLNALVAEFIKRL
ncbi:hypothetical protein MC28_D154 (plasmid) [Bacillus thuringiensis MC28]|nr:hypothetical protein MC28_D154 [Bacillus thuringiensis MC28]